jgi:hypothetical protein
MGRWGLSLAEFVGRGTVLRALQQGLTGRRSFVLWGSPGSGRTALLRAFAQQTYESWRRRRVTTKVVPVYVPLAQVVRAGQFHAQLWEWLRTAVQDARVHEDAAQPQARTVNFLARRVDPTALFLDAAADLWRHMHGTGAWCLTAYLIDDGDRLAEPGMEPVRMLLQRLWEAEEDWAPTATAIAGGRPLRELLFDDEGPLHQFRLLALGALEVSAATHWAQSALPTLSAEAVLRVCQLSGGHPATLRSLVERIATQVQPDIDRAVTDASVALVEGLQRIWDDIDMGRRATYRGAYAAPEHALMQFLIERGGLGATVQEAEGELGIAALREFAAVLDALGVAEKHVAGPTERYYAHFGLWNQWYLGQTRA